MRYPLLALLLAAVAAPPPAAAQVGYDPARSPYRHLRFTQFISAHAGWFGGAGGELGIAPHLGVIGGLRYDFLGASTLSLGLAVSRGGLERLIVDADDPVATRVTGPFSQRLTTVEGIIQFTLTGGKTWKSLAPYVSGGVGLAFGASTPRDTSGFKFGTKLMVAPAIGTRLFLSERLFLRFEARTVFWQLSYPDSYRAIPADDPTAPPVRPSAGKEWTTNGWYQIGIGYAFRRPF